MLEKYKNVPIVISGPSGAGKSELINYIENNYSDFLEATGITSRKKREKEIGRMYFVDKDYFEKLIKNNMLIEYTIYNNNYYGVSKSEFTKLKDYHLIFNVGYSSAKEIKKIYQNTKLIYLLPPNKEELIRRLGDRGMERYLVGIEETMNNAFKYEYLLLSLTNDLRTTTDDFMDIVYQTSNSKQKKLVLAKNRDFVNNFYKNGDVNGL